MTRTYLTPNAICARAALVASRWNAAQEYAAMLTTTVLLCAAATLIGFALANAF